MPPRFLALLAFALTPACVGLSSAVPDAADPESPSGPTIMPMPTFTPPGGGVPGDTGAEDDSGSPGDTDSGGGVPESDNPLAGLRFWVDPDSNAAREAAGASADEAALWSKIADHSVAKWLGGWSGDVAVTVGGVMDTADAEGAAMAFVVYNLPNRDCGGYSGGGAADTAAYEAWIDGIATGLGGRAAAIVLEPDGLSMMDCLSSSEADDRFALLAYATATLQAAGGVVYLDAGHSAWHPVDEMADLLVQAGVSEADGFALNTSNFEGTDDILAYGGAISALTGGAHFVADTARNGLGPTSDHAWCNPDGRALGLPPTVDTGAPLVDGLLWIKAPGESDGSCNGGPSAGTWWPEYALGLAERAAW
jgi:endoglucanase